MGVLVQSVVSHVGPQGVTWCRGAFLVAHLYMIVQVGPLDYQDNWKTLLLSDALAVQHIDRLWPHHIEQDKSP